MPKNDREKLLSCGSKPAAFYTLIKDHKNKQDGHFPLRPIASVRNTATEKVDWIVSQILTQLLAHPKNADELVNLLNNTDARYLDSSFTFISLKVINLYPSIPIAFGVKNVLDFAEAHWSKINHFSLNLDDLSRCLTFICYNYEITFNDRP